MEKLLSLFVFVLCISLSSCAMYKQEFECPPPQGVPCTSETDLESMIIETEKGPDIFFPQKFKERGIGSCELIPEDRFSSTKKIWVCRQLTQEGYYIEGHYIYQD